MNRVRRALIIDDEPLARLELKRLLQAHADVAVAGEAGTFSEAAALLGQPGYDLVFLDVQLRGGSGFELMDRLAPGAEIVFITAFDRYAVRAFEVNALDYLLKPVAAPRLAAALRRVADGAAAPATAAPAGRLTTEDRVLVKTSGLTRFVSVASIAAIRSCENYTVLHLADGSALLVLRSLKSWEESLPPETFVRIHRQAIVNLSHVQAVARLGEDEVHFRLTPPLEPIAASRRQLAELRTRFEAAGLSGLIP